MIELKCQYCDTLLQMDDAFAGRDGWCRECKRMVIIPAGGKVVRVEDLPPDEAIGRLQRLLSYAARKADLHKKHIEGKRVEEESRTMLETAVLEARTALEEERRRSAGLALELESSNEETRVCKDALKSLHRDYEEREAERTSLAVRMDEAALEREIMLEEVGGLQGDLGRTTMERDDLARRLLGAEERLARHEKAAEEHLEHVNRLEVELESLREQLAGRLETEQDGLIAQLAASSDGLRQLEGELGLLKERLLQVEQERDGLKERVNTCTESQSEQHSPSPRKKKRKNGSAARVLESLHGDRPVELDPGTVARVLDTFGDDAGGRAVDDRVPTFHEDPSEPAEKPSGERIPEHLGNRPQADHRRPGVEVSRASFVERWHREAEKEGAAQAQYRLGVRYERGLGVEPDEAEAIRWLTRAADQGHAGAQRHVGQMYAEGRGVPLDIAAGLRWYRRAAEQGDTMAECEIGSRYLQGSGVEPDEAEALQWYQRAANKDDAQAYYLLGRVYAKEGGAHNDPVKAARCFERSAKRGYAAAQFEMGKLLRGGTQVTRDDRRAADWLTLAAEQGHCESQLALGGCYEVGRGVVQNFAQAFAWYTLASTTLDIARTARDQLAALLSPEQVLEGQVLAADLEQRIEKARVQTAGV